MKKILTHKMPILLFALALLSQVVGQTSGTGASTIPDHITLSWIDNPAKSIAITWRTDPTVKSGFVQYQEGETISNRAKQAQAQSREFKTDLGDALLFTATLSGLSPNKKYAYRIGDGERWSKQHTFTTADLKGQNFKFLIFGDSQPSSAVTSIYSPWETTVHNAYQANPDAKFLVNLGDLVNWGQKGAEWNAWFAAAQGVIDVIPEMPALGNHEFYGAKDTKELRPVYRLAQFALPQNGPEALKDRAYSYDYGPVHFVVLDSQQEEQKAPDILKIQQAWLDADLAASQARWKIVFFHRPPYGNLAKRPNDAVKSAFCPILEKHKVDFVFNGHDHVVARTCPVKDDICVEKPEQGVIYYVVGHSGGKTYPNLAKTPWDRFFYDPQDQPNYLVVELTGDKITVSATKQDGTILDVFSIDKRKGLSAGK